MSPKLADLRDILIAQEVQDPENLRAVLHVHRGTFVHPKDRNFVGPNLFGGGVVLWGGGEAYEMSFMGWASSDAPGRAHLVQHLLAHYRNGRHMHVHCAGLKQQLDLAGESSGRTVDGKLFSGYSVLRPAWEARIKGEWTLFEKPTGLPLTRAKVLAKAGFEQASKLLEFIPSTYDRYPEHYLLWSSDGLVQPVKVF